MSDQIANSSIKFPYLLLNSGSSGSDKDGVNAPRQREVQSKRGDIKNAHSGAPYLTPNYVSIAEDPYANVIAHTANHGMNSENPVHSSLANFSMSQMKAILTAQKEMRKPAGSFYPTAAQFSLIPETEMIYKKYFPTEAPDSLEKIGKLTRIPDKDKQLKQAKSRQAQGNGQVKVQTKLGASHSTSNPSIHVVEAKTLSSCNSDLAVDEALQRNSSQKETGKYKDPEMVKFKKIVQAQLISLCGEVERQSCELSELRKEVKEVLQMTRKNATDNESCKSRLDTLSKHVFEMDNKIDSIQDNVMSQEKNFLNKLILFGDASDSETDCDEPALRDAASSPSSTKLSSSGSKQSPYLYSQDTSTNDFLPKAYSNWVPIAPDFDKLIQSIAILNYRMDRNQSMKMCTTNNGATFKHSDVIDLTLFKNGISLGSTGFRTFSTMSVIKLVNEIFNGYMPSELSTQFPDGVVIVLSDKRSQVHACNDNFNGRGTKLTADSPPDLVPRQDGTGDSIVRKQSLESLNASATVSSHSLPSFAKSISGSEHPAVKTLPQLTIKEQAQTRKAKTINLKIKHLKNGERYHLRVPIRATVKAVRDHIAASINESGDHDKSTPCKKSYDLILPVPYGKLSSGESTLEEYGLTQNTLVYIQEQTL